MNYSFAPEQFHAVSVPLNNDRIAVNGRTKISSFLPTATLGLVSMKDLIAKLVAQANLTEEQATRAADVLRSFLAEKLPEPLRGPVEGALTGQAVDTLVDQAKGLLGSLLK